MVNQRVLGRLFERHGRLVSLKDGPGRPVAYHAIIQPLRYKNKMYLQGAYSDVGYVDPGFYLYLGPGEIALDEGSRDAVLTVGKRSFVIDRAERVFYRDRSLYCWAILRSVIEEESNGAL